MRDEMLNWAKAREKRLEALLKLAKHNIYMARRDLRSIQAGVPTDGCRRRFDEWKDGQPMKFVNLLPHGRKK